MPEYTCDSLLLAKFLVILASSDTVACPCPARYTISGWVTFFLVLGLAVVFWCIFTDPSEEERRRVLPPSVQTVFENAQVQWDDVHTSHHSQAAVPERCKPFRKLPWHSD